MKTCPYCSEQIPDDAKKCPECGEKFGIPIKLNIQKIKKLAGFLLPTLLLIALAYIAIINLNTSNQNMLAYNKAVSTLQSILDIGEREDVALGASTTLFEVTMQDNIKVVKQGEHMITTKDGIRYEFREMPHTETYPYCSFLPKDKFTDGLGTNSCTAVTIDVNDWKLPNKYGKDKFIVYIYRDGIAKIKDEQAYYERVNKLNSLHPINYVKYKLMYMWR